ncbi:VanZ family protein [Anaerobacillus isosaccharinicus]|uniref:VanZ family protein n=1 Tax=Anaerobacillus isosaccharinicus TaxID=1532552 RepID=A0A1S2LUL9_9BACI|nr:VanZ family protein [Anaerobacillus isosaccharinicus]MBA5584429.1 VanZ family protein [Anaerobacillus isosaccharinicus]QOY37182.1 VanZ family protein [Anaerobacillus isosaccharinicus]
MSINKYFSWSLVLVWMILIFYLSHQPGTQSSELSSNFVYVVRTLIETFFPTISFDLENLSFLIRKGAHFFAYFVLGILVTCSYRSSGVVGYKIVVFSLVVCILYAISDEIHQLFVPGRSGEVRDVLIDSIGSACGVFLIVGIRNLRKKKLLNTV